MSERREGTQVEQDLRLLSLPGVIREPKTKVSFIHHRFLFQGIKNMDVEIYDECTFATDPQIASGNFPIPTNVVKNQVRESTNQIA